METSGELVIVCSTTRFPCLRLNGDSSQAAITAPAIS
jgi:hypothetical protein